MTPRTLLDKLWEGHVVDCLAPGVDLLHVDRHLLHDLGGGAALQSAARRGLKVRNPELTFATPDHVVETGPRRIGGIAPWADQIVGLLREESARAGVRLFDLGSGTQGIVHVMGPELGLTLPATSVVCGDSHTCTHGAFGALAFGIGSSEVEHVLATQTVPQRRPRSMRVRFHGELPRGVGAKDMALAVIRRVGAGGASGYAIEYAGEAITRLDMEERMTLCNHSIECGAKIGLVAPDQHTFDWLQGRQYAPEGATWERAVACWWTLATDEDASFEAEVSVVCATLAPHVTWGTRPEHVMCIDERIPAAEDAPTEFAGRAMRDALQYMGLQPGAPVAGLRIDRVFIGSCSNSRLPDLRRAAAVVRGRRVAAHVEAWVVPGSERTQREAEAEGLHEVFLQAGFQWRAPGCSMCVGANGELVAAGQRCVSTSNRNFAGRQGPGSRTHLASPSMATAAAIEGHIVDIRNW